LRWRTRVRAWWEGYDLSGLRAEIAAAEAELAEEENRRTTAAGIILPPPLTAIATPFPGEPVDRQGKPVWTADRVGVAETLWGQDFLTPGGVEHTTYLVKPFGINPTMSLLDLAAGLGGAGRTIAREYKAWVTGMESSALLAQMGMERSEKAGFSKQAPVQHYDPASLTLSHRYDGIFAKEAFFSVADKDRLFDTIAAGLKPGGQFLFTDYCIETEEALANPRLARWSAHEQVLPVLWPARRLASALKARKLDVRISEDMTHLQRRLVLRALGHLLEHLDAHTMRPNTKLAVLDEVELWARRMGAFEAGLRVYRFYCMKH
jgi:cyclopropane fatty-acyl-phospholipid synthase-like methyltransferase